MSVSFLPPPPRCKFGIFLHLKEAELWLGCVLTPHAFKSLFIAAYQDVRKNISFMSSVLQRKTNHITTSFFTHLWLIFIQLCM